MIYERTKEYLYFDDEFYLIPNEVLENEYISNKSKLLFASFHLLRNQGKEITVSNKKISSITNLNEDDISELLKELDDNDFISKSGRGYNRKIKLYRTFNEIHSYGDYTRIPSLIVEHEEITPTGKLLYIHLLKIYYYKLNLATGEVRSLSDLFTQRITRRNLALKINKTKNTVTNTVKKLTEIKYNNKPVLITSHKNFYQKKNRYCCYIVTPTTKDGYELLKEDLNEENDLTLSFFE